MAVRFTQHARDKFGLLERHGFSVTEAQVIETAMSPERVEAERDPIVAQKALNETHVLRVVYREEGDDVVIITFYPGRRTRYED
jgi:hypothetical protein